MFRCLLALLVINTYSCSFGNPVPLSKSTSNLPVAAWLSALAKNCGHSFLVAQINSKLDDCNVPPSPLNEIQFECMIFYDINTQLCEAVSAGKLVLNENYTAKINASLDVENLCKIVSDWQISNLTQYPFYKTNAETVLYNPISCSKVCGVPSILSQDTNFFCKYFKWGSEMISHQDTSAAAINSTSKVGPQVPQAEPPLVDLQVSNNSQPQSGEPPRQPNGDISVIKSKESEKNNAVVKPENQVPAAATKPIPHNIEETDKNNIDIPVLEEKPGESSNSIVVSNEGIEKPSAAEMKPPGAENASKSPESLQNPPVDSNDAVTSSPKANVPDPDDDYQDENEERDHSDTQGAGDEGDDVAPRDSDVRQDFSKTKPSIRIENSLPSITGDVGSGDFNPISDVSDSDDHFFPFFLTAVILVVLVYILYHNKSKVGKVFFGLIVEGRQSGRRRNSRGHAYKRLDTLEQAMSATTAAPPSKIIY